MGKATFKLEFPTTERLSYRVHVDFQLEFPICKIAY